MPKDRAETLAREVTEGLLVCAEDFDVALLGGDTNTWSGPLVVNVMVGGAIVDQTWSRCGAKPGDWILATGEFGGSLVQDHHLMFTPRVKMARQIAASSLSIRAATDVTDGLAIDLHHICTASHCGAELDRANIPISFRAELVAGKSGNQPLHHALYDGEDFELLLVADPETGSQLDGRVFAGEKITAIGRMVDEPGLFLIDDGSRSVIEPVGYEHG